MEEERGQPTIQLWPPNAQSKESQSLLPAAEKRTKIRLREGRREEGGGRRSVGGECARKLLSSFFRLTPPSLPPSLPSSLLTVLDRGGGPGAASNLGGLWI